MYYLFTWTQGTFSFEPDVVHCNDWMTGLVPKFTLFISLLLFAITRSLATTHSPPTAQGWCQPADGTGEVPRTALLLDVQHAHGGAR